MCISSDIGERNRRQRARRRRGGQSGMTLVEVLIGTGLGGIVLASILAITLFTGRSFAALANYADLDNWSRAALDEITMEIRQADFLVSGSPTSMQLRYSNPTNSSDTWTVEYVYHPETRVLARIQGGNRRVLLEECDFLEFTFFKRTPAPSSFELYETAPFPLVNPAECKAVQMRWICSRSIMQEAVNTESVQSARVIIRKK